MKLYNCSVKEESKCGNDPADLESYELQPINTDNFEWLAYAYFTAPYEGEGEAIGLLKDGNLMVHDLGHCSCYGPLDGDYVVYTVDQLLYSENVLDRVIEYPSLRKKVEELLGLTERV